MVLNTDLKVIPNITHVASQAHLNCTEDVKRRVITRVPVCCWSPCSGTQITASCVLACYWSMAVCYWGSSQSQTTTQLAGIWAPLHGDQQHTGTLVIYGILELCQQTSENGMTPCDYWTYFPSISKCFMLESCSLNDNPEAFSGERNCPPGRYLIRILLLVFFVHFPFFSFELPRKRCILHTELWHLKFTINWQCYQSTAVCK